jgi:hypothetical protein
VRNRTTSVRSTVNTQCNMQQLITAGGRIVCRQCSARSKRTKERCRAPAITGKAVCRAHGGRSTGPRTEEGKQRCATAKVTHGRETRRSRAQRKQEMALFSALEGLAFALGMITVRTRGRKPFIPERGLTFVSVL